jgi:hypothetical protein
VQNTTLRKVDLFLSSVVEKTSTLLVLLERTNYIILHMNMYVSDNDL